MLYWDNGGVQDRYDFVISITCIPIAFFPRYYGGIRFELVPWFKYKFRLAASLRPGAKPCVTSSSWNRDGDLMAGWPVGLTSMVWDFSIPAQRSREGFKTCITALVELFLADSVIFKILLLRALMHT